jgi:hypothetical protein
MAMSEFALGVVVGVTFLLLFIWMALDAYYRRLP